MTDTDKNRGTAAESAATREEADAELKRREAEARAGGEADKGNSPKPHGDKLEEAVHETAKG